MICLLSILSTTPSSVGFDIIKISEPSNKKRNNSRSCKNNQGFEQFKKEFLNIYPKETDSNILAQWERMDKETKSMYLNI